MKALSVSLLALGALVFGCALFAPHAFSGNTTVSKNDPVSIAVEKGAKWLVSTQGKDGGWGQDGGETSYVRQGEHLESNGNDVANTAVAATALLRAGSTPTGGEYQSALLRAVDFILRHVDASSPDGLEVSTLHGTQIQRKLGPYIDTFLTSKLLAELDGTMGDAKANARVRQALQKCVAKIEKNQMKDGSWNIAGGWAPILGTSMASRSLYMAQQKGVAVNGATMAKVDQYTTDATKGNPSAGYGSGGGMAGGGRGVMGGVAAASPASAGVQLYQDAQVLEQLGRTESDRKKNAAQIKAITGNLSNDRYVMGFGSFGGEEFFSYLNISDSLRRTGGPEWDKWNGDMKTKLVKLQNEDGSWAGHHCITGRVAVTSAAILTMLVDRESIASAKKN
ncbi:MAG TPA: prenyltransferase/squalene oxidase repeat-containing protein [Bryobacteraceae bacterium]|nr:prenyltransferase/squalene oxidase repeat-containing protein [Bryobacteraceae bacterium]